MKKKDNAWKWLPLIDAAELAVRVGLISSAAFVTVLGQFVLAGILLLIAVGVFFRLKRKKKIGMASVSNPSLKRVAYGKPLTLAVKHRGKRFQT